MPGTLRARLDQLRANFFFLPMVAVVAAYVSARWMVGVELGSWVGESTVDSAQAVLTTVAAATITFASISFSVALLIMQQGSSQFSPRVIHGLTRDPFNRRVIAVVLGTFTFCLVTLQRVRGAVEDGGEERVPHTSVAVGVLLGIVTVLAIAAAIHHTSQQMDVSNILERIVTESRRARATPTDDRLHPLPAHAATAGAPLPGAGGEPSAVRATTDGWVQALDLASIARLAAPGGAVELCVAPGRFVVPGTVLCRVWPAIDDADLPDATERADHAVRVGTSRSMADDPGWAVRQLVDVALRALSPGVNDPTTAQDAIFHLGTVLVERLTAEPIPRGYVDDDGRRLHVPHALTDDELADLAVTELRQAAAAQPMVTVYLLEMIGDVAAAVRASEQPHRAAPLAARIPLIVEQARRGGHLAQDIERIERAAARTPG